MKALITLSLIFTAAWLWVLPTPLLAHEHSTITYHEPSIDGGNHEIRRREGGLAEEGDGSTVRGAVRGVTRGATRGSVRGAVRGAVRGVVRGAVRGAVRGVSRGAVRGTTRGASRGKTTTTAPILMDIPSRLVALAPLRTGLTSSAQPTLYWFISNGWNEAMEFTLIRQGVADPVARFTITPPTHAGTYAIALADHHITLKPGIEYEWFINIILDPVERSGDMFGSGTMIYQPHNFNPSTAQIFSEHGYWYDAIDTLAKAADHPPAQIATASLLRQQHLPLASQWFTKQAQQH